VLLASATKPGCSQLLTLQSKTQTIMATPFNENSLPLAVILHIQIAPHPTLLYAHDLNLPELTYDFDTSGLADLPSTTHVLMHHDICQPYYLCATGPLMGVLVPTLLDETLQAIRAVCIHPGPFTLNGYLDNDLQVSNSCQSVVGYF